MIAEIVGIGTGLLSAGMSLFKSFGGGGGDDYKLQEKIADKKHKVYKEQYQQSVKSLDVQKKLALDKYNLQLKLEEIEKKKSEPPQQSPYRTQVIEKTPVNPLLVLAGAWILLKGK